MVTLPGELLNEVDSAARALKQNRSELVRRALAAWLQQMRKREFEELLAEGYSESAERWDSSTDWGMVAQAAATDGNWVWDE